MGVRRVSEPEDERPRQKPATTLEGREQQLIAKAVDAVERRIDAGTASAQELCFYLKLGSTREQLEQQRLLYENKLIQAKTEMLESQRSMEELYGNAIRALGIYQGQPQEERGDRDEDPDLQ